MRPEYQEWNPPTRRGEPTYRCHLHAARCCVNGCDRSTWLMPMCPAHARELLGIELRANDRGCGVYAVRSIQKGQLITPYLGRLHTGKLHQQTPGGPWANLLCPHATHEPGLRRTMSPYAIQFSPRRTIDASCHRSWASMVNHSGQPGGVNAELARYKVRAVRFPVVAEPDVPVVRSTDRRHCLPVGLLDRLNRNAFGLDRLNIWLRSTQDIPAGSEILVNYSCGPTEEDNVEFLSRVAHRTVPPLASARGQKRSKRARTH